MMVKCCNTCLMPALGCNLMKCSSKYEYYKPTPATRAFEENELLRDELYRMKQEAVVFPAKRGDRIYNIHEHWSHKEKKYVGKVRCTHLESYLVYTETPVRIFYKCTADSSWTEIENLYMTREDAKKALEAKEAEE